MPRLDLIVLAAYLLAVVAFGCGFFRRHRSSRRFMVAEASLPGWAVGLSLFGTFLSSNTFLGVPGSAYGSNWNSFVFSLSLPIAAALAVRYFVPFYRQGGHISAYHHLEERFGPWARTYASACYLLTQLARTGSILFGVALGLGALTGWSMATIIVGTGVLVTLYTLLGGIEAVIWTDVVQSFVLVGGALLVVGTLIFSMPDGLGQILSIAAEHNKLSLGSFDLDFTTSTFWVVALYGLFINLTNFGIDQSYIQRYHAARSDLAAGHSVWLAAALYVPISLLFFFIGSSLFAYYQASPELLEPLRSSLATAADEAQIADRVFPHFIVSELPPGIAGLLIAAIAAAAMSSIDTSLNSSATVLLSDFYKRYFRPSASDHESLRVLYAATILMGVLGTATALAMIGIGSLLDAWWTLSGIFAGGLLGLFLLGFLARRADRTAAMVAVSVGVLVILWMSLPQLLPEALRSPFHSNMITVVGTLSLFLTGVLVSTLRRRG